MTRSKVTTKPVAKRTASKGVRATKPVEPSYQANLRPRQPKLRQTPPRRPGPKTDRTNAGLVKSSRDLRNAREKVSAEVVERAAATGMLPHEWLLAVMRGEQINHYAYDSETQEIIEVIVLPTFADRMEAAKSAAPYFANKLVPEKRMPGTGFADPSKQPGVMEVPLENSMEKWTAVAERSQQLLKKEVTK